MTDRIQGRVLVVDADYNTLGTLSRALRARAHHVTLCADGRAGLQRAVEGAPDVVLVDREVPVVDVLTFLEVLRDNPRTSGSKAFVMSDPDPAHLAALQSRVEVFVKPFHVAELVSRIEDVLRKRRGPQREPELRGDLEQVALFDLLQVFAANRRTGTLRVEAAGATGEICVKQGRVVDSAYRGAAGEKALYRLLAATEGHFVFFPDIAPIRETVEAPTDMLLMEAVRQVDELNALDNVPNVTAHVALARRPGEVSEMAQRVLTALGEDTRGIDELLDVFPESDLAVMKGIKELVENNALAILDGGTQRAQLCEEEDEVVLRAAALKLRPAGLEGPGRLAVLTQSYLDMQRLMRALSLVDSFVSEASAPAVAGEGSLGTIGLVRVAGVEVELFALPLDRALRPLWGVFLAPARAAIWLARDEPDEHAAHLLKGLRVKVTQVQDGWEHPQGAAETLRTALQSAAAPARTY